MIKIVMGLPCAGKSTFIENNFEGIKKIDLYDYQTNIMRQDEVWKSYEDVKDEIIKRIKNNEDFVVEHTLLKAIRRKYYIDAIREVTQEPIEIWLIKPNEEQYLKQCKMRDINHTSEDYKWYMDILEIPTIEEGFSKVHIIEINYTDKM